MRTQKKETKGLGVEEDTIHKYYRHRSLSTMDSIDSICPTEIHHKRNFPNTAIVQWRKEKNLTTVQEVQNIVEKKG